MHMVRGATIAQTFVVCSSHRILYSLQAQMTLVEDKMDRLTAVIAEARGAKPLPVQRSIQFAFDSLPVGNGCKPITHRTYPTLSPRVPNFNHPTTSTFHAPRHPTRCLAPTISSPRRRCFCATLSVARPVLFTSFAPTSLNVTTTRAKSPSVAVRGHSKLGTARRKTESSHSRACRVWAKASPWTIDHLVCGSAG